MEQKRTVSVAALPQVRVLGQMCIRDSLQTDYIDLYYLHADDPKREVGEIIETLNSFVREGKVRYFACSNWSAERMWAADAYAKEMCIRDRSG